jgi:hypothetical protein
VLPHGQTVNTALCQLEGLGVSYVLEDDRGHQDTDVAGAEATLAFLDPSGKDLLYWSSCDSLPQRVAETTGIFVGRCVAHGFCPTMNVLARVTLAWPGGFSLQGQHSLLVEKPGLCAPPSTWMAGVELEMPGMRFFQHDVFVVVIRIMGAPQRLASFRFQVLILRGFKFVKFNSTFPSSHTLHRGLLSVECDLSKDEATQGDILGGLLTLQVTVPGKHGSVAAVRAGSSSFFATTDGGVTFSMPVRTQGFSCGRNGLLNVLVQHRQISALIARPTSPALVNWGGLQPSLHSGVASIEAVGVWNRLGEISVARDVQCFCPEGKHLLSIESCTLIQAAGGKGLSGLAHIQVTAEEAYTVVSIHVFIPRNLTVTVIPGLDGMSGRFKILSRLQLGLVQDYWGVDLDITPFLVGIHASGVKLAGEEWACDAEESTNEFTVGSPVLFRGSCTPNNSIIDPLEARFTPFLFTGGRTSVRGFVFSPSVLHPSTPVGALLLLSMVDGLLLPRSYYPFFNAVQVSQGRIEQGGQHLLSLASLGMSPKCVRLLDGADWMVPVIPASPASLKVALSSRVLVAQHDMWGLLPTSANLVEAWLVLTDGTQLDVRADPRLHFHTSGDLDLEPGFTVHSRSVSGNFTVHFGMLGMPCLEAVAGVQVFPYSMRTSSLVCPSCPPYLTLRDDPMSAQDPGRYPSSIPTSAFKTRYSLMDGSHMERPAIISLQGPGVVDKAAGVCGVDAGTLTVSADGTHELLQIKVISRWLTHFELLCNGLVCADPAIRLAPPGDGASRFPFSYPTRLAVSLRLSLFDGALLNSSLLHGMRLEANGQEVMSPDSVPLTHGGLLVRLVVQEDRGYLLASRECTLHVHRLESLEVAGPPALFQIHCSRIWEQAFYRVTATLSDGHRSDRFQAVMTSDMLVILNSSEAGVFWAGQSGVGWVSANFGPVSAVFAVEATPSNKYYTSVRLPALPEVWSARMSEEVRLAPALAPDFSVPALKQSLIAARVLRWSASISGVVLFSDDPMRMALQSDYPGPFWISCVLRACMAADAVMQRRELQVNLLPSAPGQVDLGEEQGTPLPTVAVGALLSIPIYLYADVRLRGYSVDVVLDQVALVPVDCSSGELFRSTCTNTPTGFKAGANFSSSHMSGRILIATVTGRAMLDTVSQIHVTVLSAWIGERVLGPKRFRFAVRLGADTSVRIGHLPYLNQEEDLEMGPSQPLPHYPDEEQAPSSLDVCCDTVVAHPSSGLSRHFPSTFSLTRIAVSPWNVSLDILDPRLQLLYDETLFIFQDSSRGGRGWAVSPYASWSSAVQIGVIYTHPGTLGTLRAVVNVWLARAESLHLIPAGRSLELRRIHCSTHAFQNGTLRGEIRLSSGLDAVVPLDHQGIMRVRVDSPSVVRLVGVSQDGVISLQGLKPGSATVVIQALSGLNASMGVLVLEESAVFEDFQLPDPLVLQACRGQPVRIPLQAKLRGGGGAGSASTVTFHDLDRFFGTLVNAMGPVLTQGPPTLSVVVQGNTAWGDADARLAVQIPACSGAQQVTVQRRLVTRLVACIDKFHQIADIEIAQHKDGAVLTLVGREITSYFVHLQVDLGEEGVCTPLISGADCVVTWGGRNVLVVGLASEPFDRAAIVRVEPRPRILWGYVEVFSGISAMRAAVVAGRLGQAGCSAPVKCLMPGLPVVDTAVLARARNEDARYVMDLMLDRQRMVNHRFYSHEQELSLMFWVTDRFLLPDPNQTQIDVLVPSSAAETFPLLPDAVRLPDGGQQVPAQHVKDGWYAVQWQGFVPRMWVALSYRVSTNHSVGHAKVWNISDQPLQIGLPFRECPRAAAYGASFLLTYHVFLKYQSFDWVASQLVCRLHVVRNRIQLFSFNASSGWGVISIAVESFIRVGQVHTKMTDTWFESLLRSTPPVGSSMLTAARAGAWRHRALQVSQVTDLNSHTQEIVNITADGPVPCPHGMFFTINGSYAPLPMHSLPGEDCYGMVCVQGYRLQQQKCVPEEVSLDVTWICVIVIASIVVLVVCLLCCVRMAKAGRSGDSYPRKDDGSASDPDYPLSVVMSKDNPRDCALMGAACDPFEDVFPDCPSWGCHSVSDVQLDDFSSEMLDDVLKSPVVLGEFRR